MSGLGQQLAAACTLLGTDQGAAGLEGARTSLTGLVAEWASFKATRPARPAGKKREAAIVSPVEPPPPPPAWLSLPGPVEAVLSCCAGLGALSGVTEDVAMAGLVHLCTLANSEATSDSGAPIGQAILA
jgi:hypothetical protein